MNKKFFAILLLIILIPLISKGASFLSANDSTTCVINNGKLFCDGAILKEYRDLKQQFTNFSSVNLVSVGGSSINFVDNNTVYSYGFNASRTNFQPTPILSGLLIKQIASGSGHTCVLTNETKDADAVKCWGINNNGQLGNGTTTNSISPVIPSNLYNPKCESVLQIATHNNHVCALILFDKGCTITPYTYVKCWGANNFGQIGNGKTINNYLDTRPPSANNIFEQVLRKLFPKKQKPPQEIKPVIASVILEKTVFQVATGNNHTCYLYSIPLVGNFAKCFGLNNYGQLGNGIDLNKLKDPKTPLPYEKNSVLVTNLETNVSFIASGDNHNCAIVNNGQVKCWGNNQYGQLGDGTKINRSTPVLVSGISNAVSLSLGAYHSCALLKTGEVKCWGNNNSGQLLDGTKDNRALPVSSAIYQK
jgi:alpha-tubulin suppressor-like RCC1 family protein